MWCLSTLPTRSITAAALAHGTISSCSNVTASTGHFTASSRAARPDSRSSPFASASARYRSVTYRS
jgi:hypothetical protein